MANKLINQLGLPKSIANIFTARNIITAKVPSLFPFPLSSIFHDLISNHFFEKLQDALSLTEFELMELLDVGMAEVTSAMAHISELVCPPCQTVCTSDQRRRHM